jgi:UDP-glucose 4-epimerase
MSKAGHVLVTGGAGYIGSHTVVELLQAGHRVCVLDSLERSEQKIIEGIEKITNEKIDFHKVNCLDTEALDALFSRYPFTSVIHFAAYKSVKESVERPLDYYKNNLGSLIALLEVMRKHAVSDLIFSSSCTVYGQPDVIPVDETAPFKKAESPYGATKQMCERILEDAAALGFRTVSLRYFNPIGAHPSAMIGELPVGVPDNLVPFITQTAAQVRKEITVFGNDYSTPDGSCIRDYIHVVDVATAHVQAIDFLTNQKASSLFLPFNLGTGKGVSVLQLLRQFMEVTGVQVPYRIGARRPGDVEKVFANPSKINSEFGWHARYSLEEALLHAWNWEKKIRGLK